MRRDSINAVRLLVKPPLLLKWNMHCLFLWPINMLQDVISEVMQLPCNHEGSRWHGKNDRAEKWGKNPGSFILSLSWWLNQHWKCHTSDLPNHTRFILIVSLLLQIFPATCSQKHPNTYLRHILSLKETKLEYQILFAFLVLKNSSDIYDWEAAMGWSSTRIPRVTTACPTKEKPGKLCFFPGPHEMPPQDMDLSTLARLFKSPNSILEQMITFHRNSSRSFPEPFVSSSHLPSHCQTSLMLCINLCLGMTVKLCYRCPSNWICHSVTKSSSLFHGPSAQS